MAKKKRINGGLISHRLASVSVSANQLSRYIGEISAYINLLESDADRLNEEIRRLREENKRLLAQSPVLRSPPLVGYVFNDISREAVLQSTLCEILPLRQHLALGDRMALTRLKNAINNRGLGNGLALSEVLAKGNPVETLRGCWGYGQSGERIMKESLKHFGLCGYK